MKDLGEPKVFLGMRIIRDREKGVISLDQSEYAGKILKRFNMENCNSVRTPMESRQVQRRRWTNKSEKSDENSDLKPRVPYREAIGSLLYLAGGTRPDISYAVNVLSRQQLEPSLEDWEDVKRVMRYVQGTLKRSLKFTNESDGLYAMTDSSFSDWSDSTSTGGYLIFLYGNPVAWRSHKQSEVFQSTMKAETAEMSEACRELVSLDKAIRDMINISYIPFTIWCDNRPAVNNTQKEGSHKLCDFDEDVQTIRANLKFRDRTGIRPELSDKHGDRVKQLVLWKKVRVLWIRTDDNIADIFTKPLEFSKHGKFTAQIFKL